MLGRAVVVVATIRVRIGVSEAVHRIEADGLTPVVMMVGQGCNHHGHCTERKDRTKYPIMHLGCHSRAQIYELFGQ